jgi:hypothetical protein
MKDLAVYRPMQPSGDQHRLLRTLLLLPTRISAHLL